MAGRGRKDKYYEKSLVRDNYTITENDPLLVFKIHNIFYFSTTYLSKRIEFQYIKIKNYITNKDGNIDKSKA